MGFEIFKPFLVKYKKNFEKHASWSYDTNSSPICFVHSFKLSQETEILFNVIENDFNIDLKEINEEKEIYFILYKNLNACAELSLHPQAAIRIKNLLKNNKISKQNKTTEIMRIDEEVNSNSDISDSLKKINQLNLDDSELKPDIISEEICKLKANSIYFKIKIEQSSIKSNNYEKYVNAYKESEEKILLYNNLLKELIKKQSM